MTFVHLDGSVGPKGWVRCDGMKWLVALLGLAALIAAVRERRIRSLEARFDPGPTP